MTRSTPEPEVQSRSLLDSPWRVDLGKLEFSFCGESPGPKFPCDAPRLNRCSWLSRSIKLPHRELSLCTLCTTLSFAQSIFRASFSANQGRHISGSGCEWLEFSLSFLRGQFAFVLRYDRDLWLAKHYFSIKATSTNMSVTFLSLVMVGCVLVRWSVTAWLHTVQPSFWTSGCLRFLIPTVVMSVISVGSLLSPTYETIHLNAEDAKTRHR